jgi:putative ABC transport system ATP-binding protein
MGLMGELTLRENAEYPLRLARRKDKPDDLEALLQRLGIAAIADRFPHQASLGEQQRAAVARALILEPPLVLLDEPTSHLDSERARALFAELLAAADRGTACLVATHARDVVRNAARVVAMEEGSLRESDHA